MNGRAVCELSMICRWLHCWLLLPPLCDCYISSAAAAAAATTVATNEVPSSVGLLNCIVLYLRSIHTITS